MSSAPPPATADPWPADLSPDQVTSAKAALASVAGYLDVVAASDADPSAKDWTADVRKYAADPAAAVTLDALATVAKANAHQTVPTVYEHMTVISIDDHRTVIEACADDSTVDMVDSTGKSVFSPPTDPRRIEIFTLRLYPADQGGWLVAEHTASKPPRAC
jgi:hypothetical protein